MAGSRLPATEDRLAKEKEKENREADRSPHEKMGSFQSQLTTGTGYHKIKSHQRSNPARATILQEAQTGQEIGIGLMDSLAISLPDIGAGRMDPDRADEEEKRDGEIHSKEHRGYRTHGREFGSPARPLFSRRPACCRRRRAAWR